MFSPLNYSFTVEAYGKANLIKPIPAYPDLVASICYTSVSIALSLSSIIFVHFLQGTTNNPKGISISNPIVDFCWVTFLGVILKHKNLALATQSNLHGLELPEDAIILSYLPLAHIYEVICYSYYSSIIFQVKISSASANFAPLLLVEGLVISQEIRCVCSRMLKSWSPTSSLRFLVSSTESTRPQWQAVMYPELKGNCSTKLFKRSSRDWILPERWLTPFGID